MKLTIRNTVASNIANITFLVTLLFERHRLKISLSLCYIIFSSVLGDLLRLETVKWYEVIFYSYTERVLVCWC